RAPRPVGRRAGGRGRAGAGALGPGRRAPRRHGPGLRRGLDGTETLKERLGLPMFWRRIRQSRTRSPHPHEALSTHPRRPRRRAPAAGAAALGAAGLAAAPASAADTNVSVTVNETLAITASTASVDFGAVAEGANPSSPASVTVKSNHVGGYQLAVSRTAFTHGDIPLTFAPAAPPSGAVAD